MPYCPLYGGRVQYRPKLGHGVSWRAMTLSEPDQKLLAEVKRMHRSDDCNLALLTKYLDQGADPNARHDQGEGALDILLKPETEIHKYKRAQALGLMVERGWDLLADGAKLIALFEESTTSTNVVLPAMRQRQETTGVACVDDQGNNPLHWMMRSRFTMIGAKSLLEDRVEGRGRDDPKLHDDWLHGVNAEGNTPMMALWIAMLEHAKTKANTKFECGVALTITSHLLMLGGDVMHTNHQGECAMDLMARYQDWDCASELPGDNEGALWTEIIAWRIRKQVVPAVGVAGLPLRL